MKKLSRNRLSVELLLPIVVAVFAVLMGFSIIEAYIQKSDLTDTLDQEAEQTLNITADAAENAFWTFNEASLEKIGETVAAYPEVAAVTLIDESGQIVYEIQKDSEAYAPNNLLPEFVQEVKKDDIKIGEVRLSFTDYFLNQAITRAIFIRFIQTICVIFLILFLIVLVSGKHSVAIDRIANGVTKFTEGDTSGRISVDSGNEIKNLAGRINQMFDVIVKTTDELNEQYQALAKKEEALRISEERYRYAVDGSNDAVWDWDVVNDEYYLSRRGFQIIGLSEEQNMDLETWKELIYRDDLRRFENFLKGFSKNHSSYRQIEFRMVGCSGEIHWIFGRGKGILDQENRLMRVSGFYTEITERIKAEEAINRLAYYDVLTGLPNRAKLFEQSNQLFSENQNGALLYLDLDNFKTINDTKGHKTGDNVLLEIVHKLESTIDYETIARVGGDELVVIQKNADMMQASRLANEIMDIISQPWYIDGFEFNITCCIGITMFPEDGTDINKLLMNAESAMYLAKEQGKDQLMFFDKSTNDLMIKKIEMQYQIRQGIQNQEFIIYYQPQVDLKTGLVCGVEALVRWQHPERGMIPPFEFIPLAEESGLIIPLGEIVLIKACEQSVIWEKAGLTGIKMSVNFSEKQLNKKNIAEEVFRIIEQTGMYPALLDIEITESMAMENIENTLKVINQIKQKGIKISLDDFGTGYSSLNYLQKLPIDHLKIDKHFVQSIKAGSFEEVVIKATIEIAHSMNLIVVAEGVETKDQYDVINRFGGDQIQGYLFGKPMPADELEALFGKPLI